jgi:SEC-C motif
VASEMSVGRNDPCPCGSGRKFKQCCLPRQSDAEATRVRVRTAEGRVVMAVVKHAATTWGEPLLRHAWEDFWLYEDVPDDMHAEPEWEGMFLAWFTCGFVPDPECAERTDAWPTEPLGLHWLASQRGPIDALDRAFAEQACASPLSVFVVEQVTPGVSLDVKDVLTGRSFHTPEIAASRTLRVGDLIFSRVVTLEGLSLLFGMAPYVATPEWHGEVLDWRDHTFRKRAITRESVADAEFELRDLYLDVRDSVLNPAPPEVTNTDGDPLIDVTLTYTLAVEAAVAYERLLPLATLGDEVSEEAVTRDAAGAVTSAELVWVNRTGKTPRAYAAASAPTQATLLGVITLNEGRLMVQVNSEKRATAIARQIRMRFGEDATLLEREVSDPVGEAFESSGDGRQPRRGRPS